VHTSAKARLTSVAIRIRIQIRDLDCHQHLIVCSLALCQPSLKISCKSVQKFSRKGANRQTDNDENTTSFAEVTILYFMHESTQQVRYYIPNCKASRSFVQMKTIILYNCFHLVKRTVMYCVTGHAWHAIEQLVMLSRYNVSVVKIREFQPSNLVWRMTTTTAVN